MILKVKVVRYLDDAFPGWLECEFFDAENRRHVIVDKVPVLGGDCLGPDSLYPRDGEVRCEILDRWQDANGRDLLRVTTQTPDAVETTEELVEFVVSSSQVVSAEETIARLEKEARSYEEKAAAAAAEPRRACVLTHSAATGREWAATLRKGHWRSR